MLHCTVAFARFSHLSLSTLCLFARPWTRIAIFGFLITFLLTFLFTFFIFRITKHERPLWRSGTFRSTLMLFLPIGD